MLDMLLKQAGIDPAEIKNFANSLAEFIKKTDNNITAIRAENAEIIKRLDALAAQPERQDHE